MEEGLDPIEWIFYLGDVTIRLNPDTFFTSLGIILMLGILAWWGTRRFKKVPDRFQSAIELLVESFDHLLQDSLGKNGRKYITFSLALFLFIFISNIVGVLPFGLTEPTRDLNVPVALAIITFIVANWSGIRKKGLWPYLKEFGQPIIIMLPINIIGEVAKIISLSFRLYGNILGSAIIILILSELFRYILLPVVLNAFFGLAIGLLQAFVFMMISITYIAVAVATDEEEQEEESS